MVSRDLPDDFYRSTRSRLSGRKDEPAPGTKCRNGHADQWKFYGEKTGWVCRECKTIQQKAYRKHMRMTEGDAFRAKTRAQYAARKAKRAQRDQG